MKKRMLSLLLTLLLVAGLAVPASAWDYDMEWFLKNFSDWHFDLTQKPNENMSIEEFVALEAAYCYYSGGADVTDACRDRNGKLPSAWCARYVQAEVNKNNVLLPSTLSWSSPVTVAFAAQYIMRSKGINPYDSNNLYTFKNTAGLTADDLLYLSAAVDYGILKAGADVSAKIPRSQLSKWEIPKTLPTIKAPAGVSSWAMKEVHGYFDDPYSTYKTAKAYYDQLVKDADAYTMVTFQVGYLTNTQLAPGCRYLRNDTTDEWRTQFHPKDPVVDAIRFCNENGKIALFGVSMSYASGEARKQSVVHNMLQSTATMRECVGEIVSAVETYHYGGVNLGLEYLASEDRAKYCELFLPMLAEELHSRGKVLLTTVGAYFTDAQEAASPYDYAKIGAVSDYVHVILYDDNNDTSYTAHTGEVGEMSHIKRIGRCLRYAATKMPAAKLLIGLSTFAVDFNTTQHTAADISYGFSINDTPCVQDLLRTYHPTVGWDSETAGAYFHYTDAKSNSHTVRYDSDESLLQRVQLAYRYGFGGLSIFHLTSGNSSAATKLASLSSYQPEQIQALNENLVPLSLRGSYKQNITRAEFCYLAAQFLEQYYGKSILSIAATHPNSIGTVTFPDTNDETILAIASLQIVNGSNGYFNPNNSITRQEAAVILKRMAADVLGLQANGTPLSFKESFPNWAKEGVSFVSACTDPTSNNRVMGGTGNDQFSPKGTFTREQSIVTMIRLFHLAKQS